MSGRPGADQIAFHIGEQAVTARCALHLDFAETYPYGDDRQVPATWFVRVLADHLSDHPADAPDAPAVEKPAAEASQLDEFEREVAARCRWAMTVNASDPDNSWPDRYRIAVALVLGNLAYLRDMGPGPGYTPEQAAVLLIRGMTRPPANLETWIGAIRDDIKPPPRDGQRGLWLPPTQPRTGP
ncbi:hypothetical protein [Nucisporomicrobium flavum]|uniref:hypothetical protein n=1 Tax=Nucisporomicrobium flavum TaxID=2785915 RepID=UPI0018F3BA94|nr:hypothetical protein [Nucisporomicrobium flavum]